MITIRIEDAAGATRGRPSSVVASFRLVFAIAFVRGPIISSMPSTSIWNVSGVTSTYAGTMPLRTSGAMSVENVTADVTISSPGARSSTSTAR